MLAMRDAIPQEELDLNSRRIMQELSRNPDYLTARNVLLYASIRSEVNTWSLIRHALASGKNILLPRVERAEWTLSLRRVENLDADLRFSRWGIREPSQECAEIEPGRVDFMLVPGVAFDARGHRLGFGGGFYDELLTRMYARERRPVILAVAFDCQLVAKVPTWEGDVPVPKVITEKRIIHVPEMYWKH